MMKASKYVLCCLFVSVMWLSAVQAESTLRVGAIVPLTGPGASYGMAIKNGYQLAENRQPENFKHLRVVWEDSHLDSAAAVSAYRKLTAADKVNAILVWGAGPAEAVVPIAVREGVPTFAITADRAISIGKTNVFRFHYHAVDYVKPLAEYIREHGMKRLALLSTQIAYFGAITKALQADLGSSVIIQEAGSYTPSDADFRTVIAKLKKDSVDGLLVFLLPGQIAAFHQQAEQLGLRTSILGTDFYDSISEIRSAGPNASGAVFPAFTVDDSFRQRYVQRFGTDEQLPYAANTYDFFNFLYQVIASHQNNLDSGDALANNLRTAPPYKGVSGEYHYVESKDGSGFDVQVELKEVRNGALGYLRMRNTPMERTSKGGH